MPEVQLLLSEAEKRRVEELLEAIRTKVNPWVNRDSPLTNDAFVEEFQSRLLAQHVFLGNPLFQESFDTAFIAAARAANFEISEAPSGQRFWDVAIRGQRISLKSSKAKSLRKGTLHISKLTEAAWIQDCRTARQRRKKTLELFDHYCTEVQEIVQLRYFKSSQTYELVSVYSEILRQVLDLPISAFDSDGPTINIPIGKEPPDFTLKLDRSDAKVTLARIHKGNCVVHATWKIPSRKLRNRTK